MMESTELIGQTGEAVPELTIEDETDRYARLIAAPLQPGYGITLGNALRRVLLSSLEGAAVTSVRIDQVHHEFSVINGMQEDTTEFLLTVKELRVRPLSNRPGTLTLEAQGPGQVTAADIQVPADFEIVNPDLVLATLDSAEARLNVEFHVELGKGYVPAGSVEGYPIGVIPVDAIFSPVRKVNYRVEKTRVGQSTDYDRLVLEVWSDGSLSPVDAVAQSADILMDQFALFGGMGRPDMPMLGSGMSTGPSGSGPASLGLSADRYNTPIEDLQLSVRAYNCLKRSGLMTVGQVLEKSEDELLQLRNFGRKSYDELKDKLIELAFVDPTAEGLKPLAEPARQRVQRRPGAVRSSQVMYEDEEEEGLGALGKALKEALKEQGVDDLIGADDDE